MKRLEKIFALQICFILGGCPMWAQDICRDLIKAGVHDKHRTFTSAQNFNYLRTVFCNDTTITYQQANSGGFNLGVNFIGMIDAALGGTTKENTYSGRKESFCALTVSSSSSNSVLLSESDKAGAEAMTVLSKCLDQTSGFAAVVVPLTTLEGFDVDIVNNVKGDNRVTVKGITGNPVSVACKDKNNVPLVLPKAITPPYTLACTKPQTRTVMVAMNTDRGRLLPTELPGTDRLIPEMQAAISELQSRLAEPSTFSNGTKWTIKTFPAAKNGLQPLIPENEGFCFLTYAQGLYGGDQNLTVRVDDGRWMLYAATEDPVHKPVAGGATCVSLSP